MFYFIFISFTVFQSRVSQTVNNYWWYGSIAARLQTQHQNEERQQRLSSVCVQSGGWQPMPPRPNYKYKYTVCRPGIDEHATEASGRSLRVQRGRKHTHGRWEGVIIQIFSDWYLCLEITSDPYLIPSTLVALRLWVTVCCNHSSIPREPWSHGPWEILEN